MKLADWLVESRRTPSVLRRSLGIQRSTMQRYLTGTRIPSPATLQRIIEISDGHVQLVDFLDPAPPECALVVQADGRERWVLPWSPDYLDHKAAIDTTDDDGISTPLQRAFAVLGRRASLTKRGVFLLDGVIADARRVVMAANAVLRSKNKPLIVYPGVEVPHE